MTDRLYRSSRDRVVGGVCAGLGIYFRISPVLVRVSFIALTILGGIGVLLYLMLWIVVPSDLQAGQRPEMIVAANAVEIGQSVQEMARDGHGAMAGRSAVHRQRTIWVAVALIVVGGAWLVGTAFQINLMGMWPLALIALGIGLGAHALRRR
jgi:phage shock protein C